MGSLHNTRYVRFLLVLGAVVITIFIYASYSSNTSLAAPPAHLRSAASSQPAAALLSAAAFSSPYSNADNVIKHIPLEHSLSSKQQNTNTTSAVEPAAAVVKFKTTHSSHGDNDNNNNNKKHLSKKTNVSHHRLPTIDADALADGAKDVIVVAPSQDELNEEALARLAASNNDMLEEQYIQNVVDNSNGNSNNSAQELQKQKSLQSDNNNLLNKIPDSDVLIPTTNLQKFIENADKILKNITNLSQADAGVAAGAVAAVGNKASTADGGDALIPQQQLLGAGELNMEDDDDDEEEADAPSVIMSIKNKADMAEKVEKPAAQIKAVRAAPSKGVSSAKHKLNATMPPAVMDTSQGIKTQRIYEAGHMNDEINIEKICPNMGADLKLLILITSAQAHSEARMAIRQTWGHFGTRRDVATAFVLGRNSNETLNLALSQENFIYGDLIRGHFIDSYNNLTLKTISSLEWVNAHCSRAKYILKTDDDMFINVPKLLTFLDGHAKDTRTIYGRLAKKWKPIRNKKSKYYVSKEQFSDSVYPSFTTGPAYVLTKDIVHDLYVHSLQQVYLKLEDVFTTGIVAEQLKIRRVHANEFLNRRIAFNPCNIRKTISVHMIKSNEQFDLWKKLLDKTNKCK